MAGISDLQRCGCADLECVAKGCRAQIDAIDRGATGAVGEPGGSVRVEVVGETGFSCQQFRQRQGYATYQGAIAAQSPTGVLSGVAVLPIQLIAIAAIAGGCHADRAPAGAGIAGGGILTGIGDLNWCPDSIIDGIAEAGDTKVQASDRGSASLVVANGDVDCGSKLSRSGGIGVEPDLQNLIAFARALPTRIGC